MHTSSLDPLATTYKYDIRGNLDETHLPNGVIEHYVYNELNRLDVLTHHAPDETPDDLSDTDKLAEFDYEVRADSKRTSVTETYWLDKDDTQQSPKTFFENTTSQTLSEQTFAYDLQGRMRQVTTKNFSGGSMA